MPLKKDKNGGGSEKNGTINKIKEITESNIRKNR